MADAAHGYELTRRGRRELARYLEHLEEIIRTAREGRTREEAAVAQRLA